MILEERILNTMKNNREFNDELISFIEAYKENPDRMQSEFAYYFKKIKPYLKLKEYNDPSGVLNSQDIEAAAYAGYWKAIMKYDRNKSDNPLIWIFQLVKQRVLLDLKNVHRKGHHCINSHINPDLDINNLEDKLVDSGEIRVVEDFVEDVQKLYLAIYKENARAAMTFQLKLAFPNISRTSISKILGMRRRNGLAKSVMMIKAISSNKLNKQILETLFEV
jgi:hypothetical protein